MRKKILGAANLFIFCLFLIVTSNIQEAASSDCSDVKMEAGDAKTCDDAEGIQCADEVPESKEQVDAVSESELNVRAGICNAISKESFTAESDEETEIERKDNVVVSTPAYENRWGIELNEEEIDLLAKIVYLEARGECVEGQEAVVEVVFNRMASDLYPDTLYDVLSQTNPVQFTSWKNRDKAEPTEKEYQSIDNVLHGNTNLLRDDTLYFSTFMMTSNLDVQIENHYFCY